MSALSVLAVKRELRERVPLADLPDAGIERVLSKIEERFPKMGGDVCGIAADAIAMNPRPMWVYMCLGDMAMSKLEDD